MEQISRSDLIVLVCRCSVVFLLFSMRYSVLPLYVVVPVIFLLLYIALLFGYSSVIIACILQFHFKKVF